MSGEGQPDLEVVDAAGLVIGVVWSGFNEDVTSGLLRGANDYLASIGAEVLILRAPGAFELPLLAAALAEEGCDAVVALGAVIEGDTDHYEHVAHRASEGLMRVMLDSGVPVGFGVLACREREQALERSAPGGGNKGAEAAAAAVNAAVTLQKLRGPR